MSCGFVMVFSQCKTLSFERCVFCSVMFPFCAKIFAQAFSYGGFTLKTTTATTAKILLRVGSRQ